MSKQIDFELLAAVCELRRELEQVIEVGKRTGAPPRALWLIEQAQADLQAYIDERRPKLN
ncbi:hypothetical protein BSZ22_11015 [Bradyrhizobium canariense]|jgi:hypothetical protein|uniref:Uncharacterized protein n=1 Tax=Bradyrhizobium canariense TaxID=255045 RepID=A0A1X3GRZ1_9BRAD|nr:hypothetical protein BST65_20645 [Bradyrhizobium canariense]OSI31021.1 hypothetical protein BST66_21200 [Bradyrhizobium canariense]OSI39926.1 hypothetical protein BSZ20_28750 [Bradyrhizobium canariense]OSI48216.1 hypothetical protein BST67_19230 [Bradyrhizobium canariense]OSI50101.1 hypothetical protein BSZ15_34085 [Bradyrhizobium canariense]